MKKASEEAKEAQANEEIRRKSGKVIDLLAFFGEVADFWGLSKDVGKLRDELKAKESLKDMEKRKQGEPPPSLPTFTVG